MKRLLLLSLGFSISICANAQVSIKSAAESISTRDRYDSTVNYIADVRDLALYIGQSLYVKPKTASLREYGYADFFSMPDNKKVYAKSGIGSTYDSLVGKTYKVVSVQKVDNTYSGKDYYLELSNDGGSVYYRYPKYEHSFPFLTLGYVEKLKQSYVGKSFYFTNAPDETWADFETGEEVPLISGGLWKGVDVILEGRYLSYMECVLKNDKGQIVSNQVERMGFNFIPKATGDSLKTKYGALYEKAIRGTLVIGMPEELVVIAVGRPQKINRSSASGDQWVYSSRYLYFKSGKLTGWNYL